MKKTILSLLVALMATTGARAQGPTTSGIDWNTGTNSGTFLMPAYDVEVSTELWYCLDETKDNSSLASKSDVFLKRTLQPNGWNTFCAPFAIATPATVFGEGVKVKELTGATINGGTLTLNFSDAPSGIEACKPYLIKLPGESAVNLAADGKEFTVASQSYTAVPKVIEDVVTFQPVLKPEALTNGDKSVLFVTGGTTLTYPTGDGSSATNNINAFRAYFQLANPSLARAFVMNFGDDETGISLTPGPSPKGEGSIYTLDGRKLNGQPMKKGVYVVNGKKYVKK